MHLMDTKINLSSLKEKISSKLGTSAAKIQVKKGKGKKEPKVKESEEAEILRREALALGASEEDLALLQGIEDGESEQEFGGDSVDEKFTADLSKFIKGIGLEGKLEVVDDVEDVPYLVEEEEEVEEEDLVKEEEEEDLVVEEEEEKDEAIADEESEEEESEEEESEEEESEEEEEEEEQKEEQKVEEEKEEKIQKNADKITDFSVVDNSKLVIPGRLDWYNTPLSSFEPEKCDRFAIDRLFERATKAIKDDNETYLQEFTSNNSQKKFLSQILKDGTLNDKISALTLLIQESPLHNIKAMDTLLGFCEKKSRTAALQAINAYKDLLTSGLLPDRKLLAFSKRPLNKDLSDQHLAIYYFEDYLKNSYFKIIQILEHLSHDPIVHVKMNVVSHIFDLLKSKPEQEANLLRLGVNKLGDVENKVSGKTSFQILQLEQAHPAMKKIIVDSIIDIVFKPNVEHNAQYYGVLTLNQTILTRKEPELANSLVNSYFSLFSKILIENDPNTKESGDKVMGKSQIGRKNNRKNFKKGKKGGKSVKQQIKSESELAEERNSKLFSAVLTGLNRSFPFANLSNEVYEKHLDTLFKITHSSNFNTSVQALVLVHHIITKQGLVSDRFFRTLYESLLDSRLLNSSKQGIYLNLLFKALKGDKENPNRVLAFVKRILQICNHWLNIGTITGMLFLLSELSKEFPQIQDLTIDMNSRPEEPEFSEPKEESDKPNISDKSKHQDAHSTEYDSKKRDPKYANANNSSLWEINQFINHYHPTISIYAQALLDGETPAKPDLGLYTLSHFLDRFVYKNSKQKAVTKGSSIMQPLGGAHTGSLLVKSTNVANAEIPVNTENWLSKRTQDIKPDEQFFHQYFTTKTSKVKSKKKEEDEAAEDSDLEDNEVWDALVKSRPDVEAESDEDSIGFDEDDFSDFDEELSEAEAESDAEHFEDAEETFNNKNEESDGETFINNEDEYESDEIPFPEFEEAPESGAEPESEPESDHEPEQKSKKRKTDDKTDKKDKKSKKQKLKDLPVFASADDYSKYLDSEDEDYS